jgi:toxin ParE1/3/4
VIAKVTVEPGYFKYAVGRHFVFYRLGEERLDVIRILHNQMDIEARLED